MKNDYLVVVEAEFVRDVQIAAVPEADHMSDDWNDATGELVLGVYPAETKEEAIGDAAVYHHLSGDTLKAYALKGE